MQEFLSPLGIPPELGLTWLDLGLFALAISSSIAVLLSRDTHGWVTVGYRVPFHKLTRRAKSKVYASLALWTVALGTLVVRLSRFS